MSSQQMEQYPRPNSATAQAQGTGITEQGTGPPTTVSVLTATSVVIFLDDERVTTGIII